MRLSAIIRIAKEYLFLGVIGVGLIAVLFFVGYFVVYKRVLKGKKNLKSKKIVLYAMLIIYVVIVLGATLGIRSTSYGVNINMHLFSSYIEAWNSFSSIEWRNIILNILMFAPLGFLLPLIFKKCKTWWVTYVVGFLSTVVLEFIQLVSRRGIFDLDDIFNNTLGCIIGYGIVMIGIVYFSEKKKSHKKKGLFVASLQIPLCVAIIAFSTMFITYSKQELGNLSVTYTYSQDVANISTKVKFDDKPGKAFVYKAEIGSKDDTLKLANEILSVVNTEADEEENDVYDETIFYHSIDGNYSVVVDYVGLTTHYTNFQQRNTSGKEGLNYEELKELLRSFSIELPKEVNLTDKGEGLYEISVHMVQKGDGLLDGNLTCSIGGDDTVLNFNNEIIYYTKYKEFEIISQQEAYEMISQGKFKAYSLGEKPDIEIKEVQLICKMDSKGFYQPVYEFVLEGTDTMESILIPALKE